MKTLAVLLLTGLLAGPAFADLIVTRGTLGVAHYTSDGVSLGTLIAPGTGGLSDARGVAVSPAGDVYVSDFANSDILKFSAGGSFLGTFASGSNVDAPLGLAFGTGGDLLSRAPARFRISRAWTRTPALSPTRALPWANALALGGPQYLTFGPSLAVTDMAVEPRGGRGIGKRCATTWIYLAEDRKRSFCTL